MMDDEIHAAVAALAINHPPIMKLSGTKMKSNVLTLKMLFCAVNIEVYWNNMEVSTYGKFRKISENGLKQPNTEKLSVTSCRIWNQTLVVRLMQISHFGK